MARRLALVFGFGILVVSAFLGCGRPQPAIAGTYVNRAGSVISQARDTLVVEGLSGNSYLIHRRTGYRLATGKGDFGDWKFEREEWKAVYDASTGVMTESRNGKVITFDLGNGVMLVGRRRYERIALK